MKSGVLVVVLAMIIWVCLVGCSDPNQPRLTAAEVAAAPRIAPHTSDLIFLVPPQQTDKSGAALVAAAAPMPPTSSPAEVEIILDPRGRRLPVITGGGLSAESAAALAGPPASAVDHELVKVDHFRKWPPASDLRSFEGEDLACQEDGTIISKQCPIAACGSMLLLVKGRDGTLRWCHREGGLYLFHPSMSPVSSETKK